MKPPKIEIIHEVKILKVKEFEEFPRGPVVRSWSGGVGDRILQAIWQDQNRKRVSHIPLRGKE